MTYEVRINGSRLSREVMHAHGYPRVVDMYQPGREYAVFDSYEHAQYIRRVLAENFPEDTVTIEEKDDPSQGLHDRT